MVILGRVGAGVVLLALVVWGFLLGPGFELLAVLFGPGGADAVLRYILRLAAVGVGLLAVVGCWVAFRR